MTKASLSRSALVSALLATLAVGCPTPGTPDPVDVDAGPEVTPDAAPHSGDDGSLFDCEPDVETRACTMSCGTEGLQVCGPGGRWSNPCEAVEICGNGVDDDCDDRIDPVDVEERLVQTSEFDADAYPTFVWTGSGWLGAWVEIVRDGPNPVQVAAFGSDLTSPDATPRTIAEHDSAVQGVRVAWTGTEGAVAYENGYGEAYLARLGRDASEVSPARLFAGDPHHARNPALVWVGDGYAAVYTDGNASTRPLVVQRLSTSGEPEGGPVPVADSGVYGSHVAAVWTGELLGVLWAHADDPGPKSVEFLILDATGGVRAGPVTLGEASASLSYGSMGLAWNGVHFATEFPSADPAERIVVSLVRADGTVEGEPAVIESPGLYSQPSITALEDGWILSWVEETEPGHTALHLQRMSEAGDPRGAPRTVGENPGYRNDHSVIPVGEELFVVWSSGRIMRARISGCW